MAKRECSKGHKYDSAIYGDNCPFCPSSTIYSENVNGTVGNFNSSGTELNPETGRTHVVGGTRPTAPVAEKKNIDMPIGGTVIRPADGTVGSSSGKKVVGFLVTYSASPLGKSFNIYEGRNYVGRDVTCDVCITSDSRISGKHFSILYRAVDSKFKFKDEQSSNGTFVNDMLEDDGELKNFDVMRIGDTKFIFIAIPQIF